MNNITIKDVIDEDYCNYKKPSMFIATSKCTFKCEKDDCKVHCQNSKIALQPNINVSINNLIKRYINNNLTEAVVIGGLEPLDQLPEIIDFISCFRKLSKDDLVIYTGYTEEEVKQMKYKNKSYLDSLIEVNNSSLEGLNKTSVLVIKYGRFKASGDEKYDNVLGISLASSNQYAKLYK